MNGRTTFRLFAAVALVVAIGAAGIWAYHAGLAAGIAQGGGSVTYPGPGYGWHPFGIGFGFFGFLGTLLFIFILFGLIRAIFWRGGPGRGPWGHDHGGRGRTFWDSRFGESFDEWHRRAHDPDSSNEPPASNTTSKPA